MAGIAIVGFSGTGKSTSYGLLPEIGIKGLDPKKTVVCNVSGKDLPFRGWEKVYGGKLKEGGNYIETSDSNVIAESIKYVSNERKDIKNYVIDDAQYTLSFEYMRRAKENGFNKFVDIGVNIAKIAEASRTTRRDLKVYFIWHPEEQKDGSLKMKSIGNMVDSYLTLEGLFSVILYSRVTKGADNNAKYEFVTNNDGQFPSRSPVGMFKDTYIPNDLGIVSELIDNYNNG